MKIAKPAYTTEFKELAVKRVKGGHPFRREAARCAANGDPIHRILCGV